MAVCFSRYISGEAGPLDQGLVRQRKSVIGVKFRPYDARQWCCSMTTLWRMAEAYSLVMIFQIA